MKFRLLTTDRQTNDDENNTSADGGEGKEVMKTNKKKAELSKRDRATLCVNV